MVIQEPNEMALPRASAKERVLVLSFIIVMCVCVCLVEGVSAFVAELVSIGVLDFFLAAVGAFVYLIHRDDVHQLSVSTIGAVVCGEELVESLDGLVNAGEVGHELELTKTVNLAEDADSKVTLV